MSRERGGRVIRAEYDKDFDKLRDLAGGGKRWILELEAAERSELVFLISR